MSHYIQRNEKIPQNFHTSHENSDEESHKNIMTKPEQIINYLSAHPEFFIEHSDVLATLKLPGDVASLQSRLQQSQVQALREREEHQRERLDLILDTVQSNQDLTHGLHQIAIDLIKQSAQSTADNDAPLATLAQLVKSRFAIDEAVIFCATQSPQCPEPVDYELLCQRVSHLSSVCDDRVSTRLLSALFPNATIASCAFVPITNQQQLHGVLVLGAGERECFQPNMGVLILDRLGQLLAAYLAADNRS